MQIECGVSRHGSCRQFGKYVPRLAGVGRVAGWFVAFCVLFAWGGSVSARAADSSGSAVAARVNGMPILVRDVREEAARLMPWISYHRTADAATRKKVYNEARDLLIDRALYYEAGRAAGITVAEADVSAVLTRNEKKFGGPEAFSAALEKAGMTREAFAEKVRKRIIADAYKKKMIDDPAVPDEKELRRYYDTHRDKFKRPRAVRLHHIFIEVEPTATAEEREKARETAESLLRRIKGGEDFGAIAYERSMDPYRVKMGDFGVVHEGQLAPDLEKVVFELDAGEVSGVVETIYGFHIARVDEKLPQELMTFEEMQGKLLEKLTKQRIEQRTAEVLGRLKAGATIEIVDETSVAPSAVQGEKK